MGDEQQLEQLWINALNRFVEDDAIRSEKLAQLKTLWDQAQPLDKEQQLLLKQISSLTRCVWNLDIAVSSLIDGIGKNKRSPVPIGCTNSMTAERWQKVWSYYLSINTWTIRKHPREYDGTTGSGGGDLDWNNWRQWDQWDLTRTSQVIFPILGKQRSALGMIDPRAVLLDSIDPTGNIVNHIDSLIGEYTDLKEIYLQIFAKYFEFFLMGPYPINSSSLKHFQTSLDHLLSQIHKYEFDQTILAAIRVDQVRQNNQEISWYEPCHHKAFRRYDIVLSSIGDGRWRGAMPEETDDYIELNRMMKKYEWLLQHWLNKGKIFELPNEVRDLAIQLGEQNPKKLFLVTLLFTFLEGQTAVLAKMF